MEAIVLAEVRDLINFGPHDIGAIQGLLDRARAELEVSTAMLAVAEFRFDLLALCYERLGADRFMPAEEKAAMCAELLEVGCGISEAIEGMLEHRRQLRQAVCMLVVARAFTFAADRAHLLPGLLLTAAAAAVLVYIASGGCVVPGFRSLVRISFMVMCFLFGAA